MGRDPDAPRQADRERRERGPGERPRLGRGVPRPPRPRNAARANITPSLFVSVPAPRNSAAAGSSPGSPVPSHTASAATPSAISIGERHVREVRLELVEERRRRQRSRAASRPAGTAANARRSRTQPRRRTQARDRQLEVHRASRRSPPMKRKSTASSAGSQSGYGSARILGAREHRRDRMPELVERPRTHSPEQPAVVLEERLDREQPAAAARNTTTTPSSCERRELAAAAAAGDRPPRARAGARPERPATRGEQRSRAIQPTAIPTTRQLRGDHTRRRRARPRRRAAASRAPPCASARGRMSGSSPAPSPSIQPVRRARAPRCGPVIGDRDAARRRSAAAPPGPESGVTARAGRGSALQDERRRWRPSGRATCTAGQQVVAAGAPRRCRAGRSSCPKPHRRHLEVDPVAAPR